MRHCAICGREVNENEASILAMGGFGNPKYLCNECAADIDTVIGSKDPFEVERTMEKIADNISALHTPDELTFKTVEEIFSTAAKRAKRIKEGTYDFSEDEVDDDEGMLDIPEELAETEQDKALDLKDAKMEKKLDSIFNVIYFLAFAGALIYLLIYFLTK